jgi:cbb3-type cytochrome oxidase maturation protein
MIILLMLIPLSLMLLAVAIGSFVWAVRKGQFDDMDTPAIDILSDDRPLEAKADFTLNGRDHG